MRTNNLNSSLDQKAKAIALRYQRCEKELVIIISEIDRHKAFYQLGYKSLFSYMTDRLLLSPAVACNLSAVVRKSYQVPKLKEKVIAGEVSLCKARKIAPVINAKNQDAWLKMAQEKNQKQIEREVALSSPQNAIQEKTKYLNLREVHIEKVTVKQKIPRIKMELGVSEKLMIKLRRCQDLESQKQRKSINLETCLEAIVETYLNRQDPLRKAQRQKDKTKLNATRTGVPNTTNNSVKKPASRSKPLPSKSNAKASVSDRGSKAPPQRVPIPAKIKHQVQLRDQGRCTYQDRWGQRCSATRFLEFHHIRPVQLGGDNSANNLRLLCGGHHKMLHTTYTGRSTLHLPRTANTVSN